MTNAVMTNAEVFMLAYFVILLAGWAVCAICALDARYRTRRPPSTQREVDRARRLEVPRAIVRAPRRGRADLRMVLRPMPGLPAREVGVRVVVPHEIDRPRLGEPPSFLPDGELDGEAGR